VHDPFHERQNESLLAALVALEDVRREAAVPRRPGVSVTSARFARCLVAAQEAGELSQQVDCRQLAAFFSIGWEGAVLREKLEQSAEPLEIFAHGFFAGLPRG